LPLRDNTNKKSVLGESSQSRRARKAHIQQLRPPNSRFVFGFTAKGKMNSQQRIIRSTRPLFQGSRMDHVQKSVD
jgi:hypothetical protein